MKTEAQYALDIIAESARFRFGAGDKLRMTAALKLFPKGTPEHEYARSLVRAGLKDQLQYVTRVQRQWQTKVSKRPNRCKSRRFYQGEYTFYVDPSKWATRESYVTGRSA